jgi:hypothetical protein
MGVFCSYSMEKGACAALRQQPCNSWWLVGVQIVHVPPALTHGWIVTELRSQLAVLPTPCLEI